MRYALLPLILAASPALGDVFGFQTPSGNIACSVGMEADSADIECVIHEKNGPPAAPRPAGCKGPWGHRFTMTERGPVKMACGGPGQKVDWGDVAPYGDTGKFGAITCLSSQAGFQCRNGDGHGFFLSRAKQSVF